MDYIKIALNRLCTIIQEKHELDVKMHQMIMDLRLIGASEDNIEELLNAANSAYNEISEFKESCIRCLAFEESEESDEESI